MTITITTNQIPETVVASYKKKVSKVGYPAVQLTKQVIQKLNCGARNRFMSCKRMRPKPIPDNPFQ